jgi:hypothetical protein
LRVPARRIPKQRRRRVVVANGPRLGRHVHPCRRIERAASDLREIGQQARDHGPLADGEVMPAHRQPAGAHFGLLDGGAEFAVRGDHAATEKRSLCDVASFKFRQA